MLMYSLYYSLIFLNKKSLRKQTVYCTKNTSDVLTAIFMSLSKPWPHKCSTCSTSVTSTLSSYHLSWCDYTLHLVNTNLYHFLNLEISNINPTSCSPSESILLFSWKFPSSYLTNLSSLTQNTMHQSDLMQFSLQNNIVSQLRNIFSIVFKYIKWKMRKFWGKVCLFIKLNFMLYLLKFDLYFFSNI